MYKRQNKSKTIIGTVIAVLLIVLFGVGIYALEHFMKDRDDVEEETAQTESIILSIGDYELEVTHNIEAYLLLGTDDSGNEEAVGTEDYRGSLADFQLLLVLDRTDNKYGFLDIDRNTMAEVPFIDNNGEGADTIEEQICTAHWYGADPEQGCDNTVWSVSTLLGELPIDGYYSIHMSDIGVLNHAVGGVQVTLDEDFSDIDPEMTKGKTLVLTDEQAEIYVRGRMEIGDGTNAARMSRQMQFMEDFKKKAMAKMQTDKSFLNDLFEELSDRAVTDIPENRVSVIINSVYKGEDQGILTLKGTTKEGKKLGDGKVHEEFYPEDLSIVDVMSRLCGVDKDHIKKYTDEDYEDDEEEDEE